jgi:hypothetical protein
MLGGRAKKMRSFALLESFQKLCAFVDTSFERIADAQSEIFGIGGEFLGIGGRDAQNFATLRA